MSKAKQFAELKGMVSHSMGGVYGPKACVGASGDLEISQSSAGSLTCGLGEPVEEKTVKINKPKREPQEGTQASDSLKKALLERAQAKRGYWPEKKRKVKRGKA